MKIAVFGATGKTGRHIVEQALAAGHHVVAFARNPGKLSLADERLSIVQGDVQSAEQVEQAIQGVDAVVSVLGPSHNKPTYEVSRGTTNILEAMHKHNVRRLVVSAGAGIGDPNDAPKLPNKAINLALKLLSRNVYEDMMRTAQIVRGSDRDWVIVRVPRLTDNPKTGNVKVAWVGKGMGYQIPRADMAAWMLKQIDDPTYVRQAPAISI